LRQRQLQQRRLHEAGEPFLFSVTDVASCDGCCSVSQILLCVTEALLQPCAFSSVLRNTQLRLLTPTLLR
jgi:hypothetical protein